MKPFNSQTSTMPSSGIRRIMGLSQDIEGCIHLEVGQPDFRTPEHILDAAAQAAHDGFTNYTSSAGITELRRAIVKKAGERNGLTITPDNVVVSPGAVCSIFTSLLALVEPGDEVLLPDPGWPNYSMQMSCLGAKEVRYPLVPERGFVIDFDALETMVSPRTKAMILNTPGNPTGVVLKPETMKKAVEFANRHDIYIISDEIYEDIIFEGQHTPAARYDTDGRVITVYGFSKTFAATGLRVGYVIAPEEIARLVTKLQEPVISCASGISQKACVAAYEGPRDAVETMVAAYKERRDAAVEILRKNDLYLYTPHGAFYILVDISRTGMNSTDFAIDLLREHKVAVAPGETFGDTTKNFIRISFAIDIALLEEGMDIICRRINA